MIREICKDVLFLARKAEPATPDDLPVAADLLETLEAHADGCVGMAANMIGVAKRIIAFDDEGTYRVLFNPREDTGLDAIDWVRKGVSDGAGEIVLNSIDTDGVKQGFDLEMLAAVCDAVDVPVIASGGAGGVQDFVTLFKALPKVDAGLAASIFHFGEVAIPDLKRALAAAGVPMRLI